MRRKLLGASLFIAAIAAMFLFSPTPQVQAQSYGGSQNAIRLRGRIIKACVPTDGQTLTWVAANSDWECTTVLNVATSGQGYLLPFGAGNASGGPPTVANEGKYFQFVLQSVATVRKVGIFVSAGVASANLQVGIYSSPCSGANTLLAQSANLTATTAGGQIASFGSPVTLTPGVYWIGVTADQSSVAYYINSTVLYGEINDAGAPRIATGNSSTGAAGTLAMPTSCGTLTAAAINQPQLALLP